MSVSQHTSPQEFRPYRRFVSWLVLLFIFGGSLYLFLSVGLTIYRQRHAVPSGAPVSEPVTRSEVRGCWQELVDVTEGLRKHLENSHYLLGGYDQQEAQRWSDEGAFWRNQWKLLGDRCRLVGVVPSEASRVIEELSGAHRELLETESVYTKELLRFGREQAPRLDRLRERIRRIGDRLDVDPARPGAETP